MNDKSGGSKLHRRQLLAAPGAAAFGFSAKAAPAQGKGATAVVFLSRSGNTRMLAGTCRGFMMRT